MRVFKRELPLLRTRRKWGWLEYPCVICLILPRDWLEIEVKVHLNSDRFVLVGGKTPNNCKLQIVTSILPVCTVRVADSTKLEHLQIMQCQKGNPALPAIYTLTKTPTYARIILIIMVCWIIQRSIYLMVLCLSASVSKWCETMPLTKALKEIISTSTYSAKVPFDWLSMEKKHPTLPYT